MTHHELSSEEYTRLLRGDIPWSTLPPLSLTVYLPKPPRATHQNARAHWSKRASGTRKQRSDGFLATKEAMGRSKGFPWKAAIVQVTYYTTRPLVDKFNLTGWLKASFDGMQDAKLIEDDSGLTPGLVTVERVPMSDKRNGTFKLVITKTG